MFRSLAGAMLIALALTSCSTVKAVTGFTVDQKTVAVAVTASVAAEQTAKNVIKLPICAEGKHTIVDGCVTADDGDTIIKYTRSVQAARDSLWAAAKADPTGVGAYDAYQALTSATSALKKASGGAQ